MRAALSALWRAWILRTLVIAVALVGLGAPPVVAEDVTKTATITFHPTAWTWVSSAHPYQAHWKETGGLPVGLAGENGIPDTPADVRRAFFSDDVSALRGLTIENATLVLVRPDRRCETQVGGFGLWQTGPISPSTSWRRQPEWKSALAAVPSQIDCFPNSPYHLDITATVTAAVASATSGGSGKITFGLQAADESFARGWLTFGQEPWLDVTYTYQEPIPAGYGSTLPVVQAAPTDWAYVESGHPDASHWNETGTAPAGAQADHRVARSFFRYDISALTGNRPLTAQVWVERADVCRVGELPLELWETGPISSDTTWRRQPEWVRRLGVYTWGTCQDRGPYLLLDAGQAVADAIAAGRTTITVGLRARNEHDPLGSYVVAHNSVLHAQYSPPLATPTDPLTEIRMWTVPCVSGPDRPFVPFVPQPSALVQHIPGLSVRWQWETLDGQPVDEEFAAIPPGQEGRLLPTKFVGVNGGAYRWRVRVEEAGGRVSEWTQWCEYAVDMTKPSLPAVVTGDPYGGPVPKGAPGVEGTFTFGPNGVPDIARYEWHVDSGPSQSVPAGPDGTATVTYTPATSGLHIMYVVSKDRAGNQPDQTTMFFFVVG